VTELETARKNFLTAHKAWEVVNNPEGWESGEVHAAFAHRTKVLLEYNQAKTPFRQIYRIIKARSS
jgi:hypothetical protein